MMLLTVISLLLYIGSSRSADGAIEGIPMTDIVVQTEDSIGNSSSNTAPTTAIHAPLQAAKRTHRRTMNFYVIGTVLLGGLVTFAIAKRSLRPLEDFERQIKAMDYQKLSEKIVIHNPEPDVGCLVDAFNEMTDKLEQNFVLQKQFSHSVAHELRTPLTVMRTKIEVFQKKTRTPEEYHALLTHMQTYTQTLSDMVEDILQYSNLSDIPLEDDIALDDMLVQVADELGELYPNSSIRLDAGGLCCRGNAVLLHRVFFNLMENACRYGQGAGAINIRAARNDEGITIQVCDGGIGVQDCDKPHLFEPFFRVDKSRSRAFGGVGLGLFFCKEIVSRHGGVISVCDNLPCGTIFTVTLPV